MDFVADELTGGRKFRTLTVLDLFTRQCLDIAVADEKAGPLIAAGDAARGPLCSLFSGLATVPKRLEGVCRVFSCPLAM